MLNDTQRKLVEDNHKLIYGFLRKQKLDIDEWYDIAAIGLCNAAKGYNGKSKFSTLAYMSMLNAVRNEMRTNKRKKRGEDKYLEVSMSEYVYTRDTLEITYEEYIPSSANTENIALSKIWAEWFISDASLPVLRTLYSRLKGNTYREAGMELGLSPERCCALMKNTGKRYKEGRNCSVTHYNDDEKERKELVEKILKMLDK